MQVNSYQAIIVSDVLRTYTIFSYKCGDLEWSALGRDRAAVVGFNANGEYFQNHLFSGFAGVETSVSCTRQLKRRKRQEDEPVNINMELPTDENLREKVEKCINAIGKDELLTFGVDTDTLLNKVTPCPCTRTQANADKGRFRRQNEMIHTCYISTRPTEFQTILAGTITLTQQCCYDNTGYENYIVTSYTLAI